MTMALDRLPGQCADGKTARWRKLYDLVRAKRVNDQITYDEAEDLLGLRDDPDRTKKAQAAMVTANRHLKEDREHSVRTEANYGWIVMPAAEHVTEAKRGLKRTQRQAQSTVRTLTAIVDRLEELSPFERQERDRILYRAHAAEALSGKSKRSLAELVAESQRTSRLSLVPPQTA